MRHLADSSLARLVEVNEHLGRERLGDDDFVALAKVSPSKEISYLVAARSNELTDNTTTELGLNVLGGAVFQFQSLRPFVQAELNLGSSIELYGITGGVLFSLGG